MARNFPSMLEYQESIQNPASCFSDAELAGGTVVLDPLGLPKPITGGFASVYQVKTKTKHFAVRCFLRPPAGVADRYALISDFVRREKPRWMTDFVYLEKGIKVHGQWYPILKMEWIQGEPLNLYVAGLIGKRRALLKLAEQFLDLLAAMNALGISHGDLQHGNILVAGGQLRLIDYDAMYIDGMSGKSHEVGHRNFQHPKRSENDFGPFLDHFSGWVTLISLRALARAPKLWLELDSGDEGLLLRKEDFLKPEHSKAFLEIEKIADDALRLDLTYLKFSLNGAVSGILSPLDSKQAHAVVTPHKTGVAKPAAPTSKARSSIFSLFHTHIKSHNPSQSSLLKQGKPTSQDTQSLVSNLLPDRLILTLGLLWSILAGILYGQGEIEKALLLFSILATFLFTLLFYALRFMNLPLVRQQRELQKKLEHLENEILISENRLAAIQDIEKAMATSHCLNFKGLLETMKKTAGQDILDDLSAFLQEHPMGTVDIPGIERQLAKDLSRKGFKNSFLFKDVKIIKSLGEGELTEDLIIVLSNGKEISSSSLDRAKALALFAWRRGLEAKFITKTKVEDQIFYSELIQQQKTTLKSFDNLAWVNGYRYLMLVFGLHATSP